jgi:hypothetical protein
LVLGTPNKAFQWHITCRTREAADVFVKIGRYVHNNIEGFHHTVVFAPLGQKAVQLQILWVPAHIPDYAIRGCR